MNLIKNHKNKIIIITAVIAVLVFTFFWGGNSPQRNGTTPVVLITEKPVEAVSDEPVASESPDCIKTEPENTVTVTEPTYTDTPQETNIKTSEPPVQAIEITTDEKVIHTPLPKSDTNPAPIEPENAVISDKELTCTLSVRCDTFLTTLSLTDSVKAELVPSDGIIFSEQNVTFYEGESVFNVLSREMKKNKIHFEFVKTPIYNSVYIEGIANIYEFDCGELSGWMYKVNGWFPNYGCSRYQLQNGDSIEIVYTCDLGKDVGGAYSPRNGM